LGDCALAQIIPDTTLSNENSTVISTGAVDQIDGGATRGANLFHSFQEFNIGNGRSALFSNPPGIENILSRVTGVNPSFILGTLGVSGGNANLFLINPNGIIFGQNASLNVGGSFVASTANAVQFGNIGFFSATDKNIPSPLLTINPSALLFNQINQNAAIQNNSVAPAGTDPAGFNADGLRVPDGKSLLLVGGNVSMDGGRLNASGGRVELGGLAEPGTVVLGVNGDNLSLIFPENVTRSSVSLSNQAAIYVEGASSGNIAVNARNLEILGRSILSAGIGQGLGTPETVAGDITLNAIGEIKIAGGSIVLNLVNLGSQGNGGNITIDSSSFSLRDGAKIAASTFGQGNAGNVTVSALDAVSLAYAPIFSTVETGGVGKGGNININAATLSLIDGAQLLTLTRGASPTQPAGQGDAGNVNVNVTGAVDIAGQKNVFFSAISSLVETGAVGNGGNITINSGSFSLRDRAYLSTSAFGQGSAGNVTVRVLDAVSLANAYILSTVEAGGVGKGGNININAATLSLIDGAQLQTLTREASDTQPAGRGDAGNVNVNVTGAVDITGEKNNFSSGISSSVQTGTEGNGGNININSASFSLRDGAQLNAVTSGRGNAGNVTVRVLDAVSLANAYILSTVEAGGVGKGGNININAATLSLIDGAQLLTLTRGASPTQPAGRGDAGNVNVNVTGAVDITGEKNGIPSGIRSQVNPGTVGNGGKITVDSGSFSLRDGAQLTAETLGQGNAGTIKVNAANVTISGTSSNFNSGLFVNSQSTTGTAGDIIVTSPRVTLDNSGTLTAESALGNGGNINVQTDLLLLRRDSQISTTAGTVQAGGNGGNITINAPSGFIVAVKSENSDITANAFAGSGGRVQINAFGIFGMVVRSREDLARLLGTQDPTKLDPRLLPTSDITAISQTNPSLNGQVTTITPDVDPNSGLVNLPAVPVDTSVAQTCTAGGAQAQSSFIITGRGGLPPNPKEALSSDDVVVTWVLLNPGGENSSSSAVSKNPTNATPAPLVEAQGWVINDLGQVVLIATAPTVTPHSSWQTPNSCGAQQSEARAVD
jgi:filamentous hemagglutinin family protein